MNETFQDLELVHNGNCRPVPVRIYRESPNPRGWIVFSVGYGGQRSGYGFMARAWAKIGFHVVVVEHVGSNLEVLKSFPPMRLEDRQREVVRRVQLPEELLERPKDLALVYEAFKEEYLGLGLGLAGHSYGSYSVLAAAGLSPRSVPRIPNPVPAVGLLVISPQPPGMLIGNDEFSKVDSPVLLLTGTEDHHLAGESTYRERIKVYEELPADLRHMVVLKDCEHMTFAGMGLDIKAKLSAISELTSQWWDWVFSSSVAAASWDERVVRSGQDLEIDEWR